MPTGSFRRVMDTKIAEMRTRIAEPQIEPVRRFALPE